MSEELLKKYIKEGKIYAELYELFKKIFIKDCFSNLEISFNQMPIKIVITILNPSAYINENKYKIRQLQNMIAQRLSFSPSNIDIVLEKIQDKNLDPTVHAERLRMAFLDNKPYKRVVNQIIKSVRLSKGQGVMVRVSGKLKGQRARSIKFFDGLLIQSGKPAKEYIKHAKTEAKCKQGIIGIQVKVMLPYDPEGIRGPSTILPDKITVLPPKQY